MIEGYQSCSQMDDPACRLRQPTSTTQPGREAGTMPALAKRPCGKPGCRELTQGAYCAAHKKQRTQQQDEERGSAHERGYDSRWRKARDTYLKRYPLCLHCMSEGRLETAAVVDHIIPHKGDSHLFWDSKNNWQPLCKPCHDRKTARYDGGFGR